MMLGEEKNTLFFLTDENNIYLLNYKNLKKLGIRKFEFSREKGKIADFKAKKDFLCVLTKSGTLYLINHTSNSNKCLKLNVIDHVQIFNALDFNLITGVLVLGSHFHDRENDSSLNFIDAYSINLKTLDIKFIKQAKLASHYRANEKIELLNIQNIIKKRKKKYPVAVALMSNSKRLFAFCILETRLSKLYENTELDMEKGFSIENKVILSYKEKFSIYKLNNIN